jgi:arylsulfatase A-like enzyme
MRKERLPDIVIFNPDQWRGDVLGHMGNPAAVTPVLDRWVREDAVSFSNAFCQNPVCTPSRCSFMTGWYPHVRGHRTMHHMLHPERDEPNLLKTMKDNGYFVWWGGKNDLIPGQDDLADYCDVRFNPSEEDWQRWGCANSRGEDLHQSTHWRGEPGADSWYSFMYGKLGKGDAPVYPDYDWAVILGVEEFIRSAPADKPLCIFLSLNFPHPPYGVEDPYFSMIDRKKLPLRVPKPEGWQDKPCILRGIHERQLLQNWREERWDELRATYYGMCARVDDQFGRILEALRDAGRYDNSGIMFFADHGDFTGDYGLVEKTENTFEDCLTRVPFLVKPPVGHQVKPRISDALTELIDMIATLFDWTGVEPGYDHFGRTLSAVLAGETDEHRDAVFCEGGRRRSEPQAAGSQSTSAFNTDGLYWPRAGLQQRDDEPWHTKAVMCRTKEFKYVRRLDELDELYDLKKDPAELRNVVESPLYREVLMTLRDRMLTWYQETCDVVPHKADKRN